MVLEDHLLVSEDKKKHSMLEHSLKKSKSHDMTHASIFSIIISVVSDLWVYYNNFVHIRNAQRSNRLAVLQRFCKVQYKYFIIQEIYR